MKLSELVRYRNTLDEITPGDLESQICGEIDPVIFTVKFNSPIIQLPHLENQFQKDRESILESIKNFRITLDTTKAEIDRCIESMEPAYLSKSYQLYYEMQQDTPEYTLNRRLNYIPEANDYIQSRILMYNNWQQTAAVIRPGLESWVEHILGCDPLYLIDTDYALLEPVKQKFTEAYLNRLRFYAIKEFDDEPILTHLPDRQFSFILAYNFFHYKPFDVFKKYLTEIYTKLDSGGCLAFTFNDCDRWAAVDLTERWFMCYTPGRLVRSLCESLGYEIVNSYIIDKSTTWLEIRKPGLHSTLKGGQALAKIIGKSK